MAFFFRSGTVSPIDVKVPGTSAYGGAKFLDGHIYLYGSFEVVNGKEQKCFAIIDTTECLRISAKKNITKLFCVSNSSVYCVLLKHVVNTNNHTVYSSTAASVVTTSIITTTSTTIR